MYKEILTVINECQGEAIITTHHKPDGDALGSSLALYHFLTNIGLKTTVISPTDFPACFDWMPGRENIVIYTENDLHCQSLILQANLIFCLDFNQLSRINEMGHYVEKSKAYKVMIDHHLEPGNFYNKAIHAINVSSTCELVYNLIYHYEQDAFNLPIAACLYTGIMTDTGGFKHSNTFRSTHLAIAKLLQYGIDTATIHQQVFDNYSLDRTRLIGYSLYHKLEFIKEYHTAIICLTKEELKQFNVKTGDTEGLVNYGLSIEGALLAVLIIDRTEKIKMSFRSKGQFPCNQFAAEFFEGGGHFNAAGGQSEDSIDLVIEKLKKSLALYSNYLMPNA